MATTIKSAISSVAVGKPAIVELKPYLQPFPYGREGMDSMAARFAKEVMPETDIKPDQPYGEIWLGSTHKNGPASLVTDNTLAKIVSLRDLIYSDPQYYLGQDLLADEDMQNLYKDDLPFLFKILSFDKALPLQAHPDPNLGAKLKKRELQNLWYNSDFVDKNGKPEVSVALSDFSAYIGFRPPSHIAAFARQVPELGNLLSSTQVEDLEKAAQTSDEKGTEQSRDAIKSVFGTLIGLAEGKAKRCILDITERLDRESARAVFGENADADELARLWKLNLKTYGDSDVGLIITTFCMNLMLLKKGEGCWILADDIHAYAQGDVIECMANSDNMVCHGLGETDQGGRKTFVDMLSYRHLPADKLQLDIIKKWDKGQHGNTKLYKVPIEEFDILAVNLDKSSSKETLSLPGPHTFVVTEGTIKAKVGDEVLTLAKGHTAFVKANATLDLELVDGEKGELWGSFFQKKDWA